MNWRKNLNVLYKWEVIMDSVIVILGPTASGKTSLSVNLAKQINGEIISADSMQVYKYMDIGTAKPNMEEREGITHYLMDEVLPDEEFSVATYKELALNYIQLILKKGKIPIIVGGTGLYINSLIYNIDFTETVSDWNLREELTKVAEEKGNAFLHDQLKEIDPDAALRIHENDTKRIIRAIEVFKCTGETITKHQSLSRQIPPPYNFILLGLEMNRDRLYERINQRVDAMFTDGLVNEVEKLMELGYDKSSVAMQGLGYKEVLQYLRGEITLDEVIYIIKRDTRHYAKRQMTWFRRLKQIHWIQVDNYENTKEIIINIKDYIASFGIIL